MSVGDKKVKKQTRVLGSWQYCGQYPVCCQEVQFVEAAQRSLGGMTMPFSSCSAITLVI